MIGHDFLCKKCDNIFYFAVGMDEFDENGVWRRCPNCGDMMTITYTKPPGGTTPATDNYYGIDGYFDYGAGRQFKSVKERDTWMESRGLQPAENMTVEEFHHNGPAGNDPIKVDMDDVHDAFLRGEAKLKQGWRPKTNQELDDLKRSITGE